jgi:DNA-binding transcriptional MerR regulator
VTVQTLRHYDDLGLIRPVEVDPLSGYRYYILDQLPHLHRILALKDLGFSLEQIACLLEDNLPPDDLRGMLRLKHSELRQQLDEGLDRLERLEARLRLIEQEITSRSTKWSLNLSNRFALHQCEALSPVTGMKAPYGASYSVS